MSVTCSTAACRMPPRSKDAVSMRRFAAEHIKAHGRLAGARPNAACSCGSAHCALHEARVHCSGSSLLVLVHNQAVGQVWTLAEVCQGCARHIPHITILATAKPPVPTPAAPSVEQPAQRAVVPGGFSSPEVAPDPVPGQRRQHRPNRPRRSRG
ncbi:hypothetical protein [Streptomyces sp. SPB4]|uniref:hypothetical protein n=1 Tax=Streptomyces sp. SPB4 TaxID=2940553 RepID=UPI0024738230|nr:hypothetical protein [Streptomyces sp. SPB4]MDH6545088.1 hypothetical protein [Streptomyces sp. SPB4]